MAARKTSSRGASKPVASKRQVPGWVWLFTGVVSGLFIAFLYHLAELRLNPANAVAKADSKPQTEKSSDAVEKAPRFDFYAVLPKMEVIVPKGDNETETRSGGGTAKSNQNHADEKFLLQAGSFRNASDADRRRAELILQGYAVKVQAVELESGDTWHRVMIGPFDNLNALHRAQDKMAAVGVETLPIKVKKDG